jgi:recombination associated protein RdgC
MGLLSASTSVTRYSVEGQIEDPIIETIAAGLKRHAISEIDNHPSELGAGWTSLNAPFAPDFEGSSFVIGTYLAFSLRVDKKSIPTKLVQKHCAVESAKRLKETGQEFLSANEKKMIKDHVINMLNLKMPATPNVYDVIWRYEQNDVWFFSNLKSANEQLETLFSKSFRVQLVRRIPYTMASMEPDLSHAEQDALSKLAPAGNHES